MAKRVKKVLSKSLIRRQKDALVSPSDTAGNDNALHPSNQFVDSFEASNAVMVGVSGNVTVELVRTTQAGAAIYSPLPSLAAGLWHNCEAFRNVRTTGTTASNIQVAVTSYQSDPGVPGA